MDEEQSTLAVEQLAVMGQNLTAAEHFLDQQSERFGTILADPPWQFANRTGKMAPEHRRLSRYGTMNLQEIMELPISQLALPKIPSVPLGSKRADTRRTGSDEALGFHL